MTQDVSEERPGTSASSVLETATRICLCVVGVLYAIGFAVQTLDLARYGIADTSILKAEYVLTGILVCVPIVIPGVVLAAVYMLWHLSLMKKPEADLIRTIWSGYRLLVFTYVLLFFSFIFRFAVALKSTMQFAEAFELSLHILFINSTAFFLLAAISQWSGELQYRGKIYKAPKMLVAGAFSLFGMLFVVALVEYLTSFVDTIHSQIPAGIGGARAARSAILF